MYYIIMSKSESFYKKPKPGFIFTNTGCMQRHYKCWIVQIFDSLKDAKDALERIGEWYEIDGRKYEWHDTTGVYCLTGEGKQIDLFEGDKHVKYEAFIDDSFTKIEF